MRTGSRFTAVGLFVGLIACVHTAMAQIAVNSLSDLRAAGVAGHTGATITLSSTGGDPHPVTGVVTPGHYWINGDHIANPTNSEPIFMELGGTGNTYDLSGAMINLDTRKLDGFGRNLGHGSAVRVLRINGSDNTVQGISLIGQDIALDTDPNAQRYADWSARYVDMNGDDNMVDGAHVVTRGSRTDTYGLGDAFGKGASNGNQPFISHRKASAFRVGEATNAVVNDMHLEVNTFGHGFFVQQSTNTTLTNSTVTGELFPSQGVIDRPEYQQHGHTFWGNPIQDDIMISGAEAGVRMYTGASGLTVDNVVVTNMRAGFGTALASGNVLLTNVETYGAEIGFGIRSNTTIINGKGDIVNGPLVSSDRATSTTVVDVELVGDVPVGVDYAVAYVNGSNADITITSDLPTGALPQDSLVRFGQANFNDWRNRDHPTSFEDGADPLTNATFINNTNQMVVFGPDVTGITGTSQAPVITNGKNNAYDGISIVLGGMRTVLTSTKGLGNNGTAGDGSLETNASIVESGGTLELAPGIRITDEKLTISGDGVDGQGALYSDGQVGSGTRFGSSSGGDESTIFLDGNASIGVGVAGNQLLVGSIQGAGNLTKRGLGKLSIEKASTFVGNFTVAEGEVVARSNVVNGNLIVYSGATISSIGAGAVNTIGTAFLFGEMDVNARADDNSLTATIGQLFGTGMITASNQTASQASTLMMDISSGSGFYFGQIQDNLSVVKTGAGAQVLGGASTYPGTTTVSEGLLQVDGAHTGGGAYTVENGGMLGGNGDIGSTVIVQSGGALGPGASAGELAIDAVDLQSGSLFEIEIGGTTAGSDYDLLTVDDINLGGLLEVSLIDAFLPSGSKVFTIVSATTLSGAFDNVANGARLNTLGGEGSFLVSYSEALDTVTLSSFLVAGLAGDFNDDGLVDAADYSVWRDTMGAAGLDPFTGADANGDGQVTEADYLVWRENFGATLPPPSLSVPDPATSYLALAALLCGLGRRRR